MLKAIKQRKIQLYCLLILVFGFLFGIFHQTMIVEEDFIKVDYKLNLSERTDYHNLLGGWTVSQTNKVAWPVAKQASFVLDLPSTRNSRFSFEVFVPKVVFEENKNKSFKLVLNDLFVRELQLRKDGWIDFSFVAPEEVLKKGSNKVKLFNFPSRVAFKTLSVSNFQAKRLLFLRSYMLWETMRLFNRVNFRELNLKLCLYSAFSLLAIWVFYSIIFRSFTLLPLTQVLRLDFWTYAFGMILLFSLYVIKLLSFYNPFYYRLDFWLALGAVVLSIKITQLFLFVDKGVVARKTVILRRPLIRIFDLKGVLSNAYERARLKGKSAPNFFYLIFIIFKHVLKKVIVIHGDTIFVLLFIILFLFTWPFLYFKQKILAGAFGKLIENPKDVSQAFGSFAERLGNWAFLFLAIAIIVALIKYLFKKESRSID